ncbi:hypothetical protein [Nocardia sp. NPDC050710]|uniref:hypothetical protein n=1 Tax=Nocardia sp. NPDC050710 TaxID=3157220 RepID=UPI00340FC3D0
MEVDRSPSLELILLHECGGITKVHITRDRIRMAEPTGWREVDEIEHWFCGCSLESQVDRRADEFDSD